MRVDSRADKAGGDSVSLGRWPEPVVGLSISADGRRLAFRTVLTQHSVYEGDLEESGESLLRVRRLTFGEGRDDFPRAWTRIAKQSSSIPTGTGNGKSLNKLRTRFPMSRICRARTMSLAPE